MDHPLKIDFDPTYRLAICRPVGLFGDDHVEQLLSYLLALEDSNPSPFNRLLDLTRVTEIRLSSPTISGYAKARQQATTNLPPFRTAIIAPDPGAEELALTYAKMMDGSKIQVGIFPDTNSAADWLCVPEAAVHSKLPKKISWRSQFQRVP